MIRNTDDTSPHICAFCRKRFNIKASHHLLQCPTCKDVYHLQCMLDFIRKSENISCPSCREIVPVDQVDEYISTDTLEKEWYFDFDEVVGNTEDKEFHAKEENMSEVDDGDSEDGSEDGIEDGSEDGSEEGSEDGSEYNDSENDSENESSDEDADSDSDT